MARMPVYFQINPHHLQFFATLFRERSLRATARHYGLGHGAIKRAITQLETGFGQPLIRAGNPVSFTALGERLGERLLKDQPTWQQLAMDLDRLRDTPTEVIIGIPNSEFSHLLYTELASLDQTRTDLSIRFVSDASMAQIESGLVHLAMVTDRPSHLASIASHEVIGGIRIDIEHGLFEAHQNHQTALLGGHSTLEWEQLMAQSFPKDQVKCQPCVGPSLERDRSLLASLGQGVACLPTGQHAHDPTLREVDAVSRFALHSLHLVMHGTYRNSPAHQFIRQQLIHLLTSPPFQQIAC